MHEELRLVMCIKWENCRNLGKSPLVKESISSAVHGGEKYLIRAEFFGAHHLDYHKRCQGKKAGSLPYRFAVTFYGL